MAKKKKEEGKQPDVHQSLEGFNIKINEFGEIISSFEVDKLNSFLNENVDDKKLRERSDDAEEEE